MNEDIMPTPCKGCDRIVDFRNLVNDPLEEYEMVCKGCSRVRQQMKEDYERRMYEKKLKGD